MPDAVPKKLPQALIALLVQGAAFLITIGCALLVHQLGYSVTPLPLSILCGAIAALWGSQLKLPRWWVLIEFLFAPALVLTLSLQLSPNVFLAAFLLLLLTYWSTFKSRVPLYLSSRNARQALEKLLPDAAPGQNFAFIDLGTGLGGVLAHLARVRPDGFFHGVENAPLPYLGSWLRLYGRPNCRMHWGSLWNCDLAPYDVVFSYLSPVPMERLWHKARREMRPGTLFVSNTFAVPEHPPQQKIDIDDLHGSTLYVWRM